MSNDPVGFTPDDLTTFNRYSYVGNNPYAYTDPDGTTRKSQRKQGLGAANLVAKGIKAATDPGSALHNFASKLEDATQTGLTGKTYQTYTKTRASDGSTYSGRTSGTDTPQNNVAKRDQNHHKTEQGYGPAKLDKSSSNQDAIRGREQTLIESNGGAQSQGGTSGNAINGISNTNSNKNQYMEANRREFEQD